VIDLHFQVVNLRIVADDHARQIDIAGQECLDRAFEVLRVRLAMSRTCLEVLMAVSNSWRYGVGSWGQAVG